jgi:hypothetical protein
VGAGGFLMFQKDKKRSFFEDLLKKAAGDLSEDSEFTMVSFSCPLMPLFSLDPGIRT